MPTLVQDDILNSDRQENTQWHMQLDDSAVLQAPSENLVSNQLNTNIPCSKSSLSGYITKTINQPNIDGNIREHQLLGIVAFFSIILLIVLLCRLLCFVHNKNKQESMDFSPKDIATISGDDSMDTQLDLANAYIEIDKLADAKDLLKTVIEDGNKEQRQQAQEMLKKLSDNK